MINVVKAKVREFIVKALYATDEWAMPREVLYFIDDNCFPEAFAIIEEQSKLYPNDPEVVKAKTLLSFCSKLYSQDVD